MTEDRETMTEADDTKVICPNCTHQFRAISIADQARLAQSDAEQCLVCGSSSPHIHPAMQADGGEVELCSDAFHLRETPQNRKEYIEAVKRKRAALAQSNAEAVCPRCGGKGPHMHPKTPWEGRLDFDTPDNNFERHLQPVAWRYAYPDYPNQWNITSDKLTADERRGNAGCIVEPLYTALAQSDAERDKENHMDCYQYGKVDVQSDAEPVAWKLVPKEPTIRMIRMAGGLCDFTFVEGVIETQDQYDMEIKSIYKVMLDESPTTPPRPDASAGLIEAAEWHEAQASAWERPNPSSSSAWPAIIAREHRKFAEYLRARAANRSGK